MSLTNAWIVPDCDTVLDWLAASSIVVDRQLWSIGRRRCWTWGAWHRSLCLLIEVGERWHQRWADSPQPGNQVPDQSSTGKPGQRSRSRLECGQPSYCTQHNGNVLSRRKHALLYSAPKVPTLFIIQRSKHTSFVMMYLLWMWVILLVYFSKCHRWT